MIKEKRMHRPFKWMVLDDRQALMNFFNKPTGGYGPLLIEYMKDNYGLIGSLIEQPNTFQELDFIFADHNTRGGDWYGTYFTFRRKEDAELFDGLFGEKSENV